ncbi:MAG: MMPL family transporter [Clostridia bacterium]|nr:MMPL family transporter [Clostridia bacterium]
MTDRQARATKRTPLTKIAETIVYGRFVIFALFALAAVFCVLTLGRVRVNSDLTAFLPKETETRRGIAVMEEEFTTYGSARIMIEGISVERAKEIAAQVVEIPHVAEAGFDETEAHYKDGFALLSVSFDEGETGEGAAAAMGEIRTLLSGLTEPTYVSSSVGYDYQRVLAREMAVVLALSAAVIVAVLLFTSRSYFEVVIFFIVFAFSALLNMGTNWWLGEISAITNTVAVILQLALAIDYAIIFAHRYQDEAAREENARAALVRALSRSIVEIFSSSLTTVSGLVALTLMQFRLGYDLGIVLAKGIACSMLTVFCLMPGLILLFPRALKKTRHRPFVPNVEKWGRFLNRKVPVFLLLFAVVLPFAAVFSHKTEYAFSQGKITEIIPNAEEAEARKIDGVFPSGTVFALLVPAKEYEKEKTILTEAAGFDGITGATGLAGVTIAEGRTLTDAMTAAEFAAFLGIGEEEAVGLYRGYGMTNARVDVYRAPSSTPIPFVDVLLYLFRLIDRGAVSLSDEQTATLSAYRAPIERAVAQLGGRNWDRLVFSTSLPAEGEETLSLVERVREAAEREYGEGKPMIVGNVTSAKDLRESYRSDSVLISVLSVVFVFLILLCTFRSPVAAALLVFVIEGSILINFSVPYLGGTHPSFVTNMIVSAIQMGATIDYAIVMMSRYRARRAEFSPREAMAKAVNDAFPTVITSGIIMAAAGLLVAFRVSDVYVGHIGLAVGRGALISMLLVLTVLPQLIPPLDRAIAATTLRLPRKKTESPEGSGAES